MDDEEKRFVDELLDASLRRYASAEPGPGLEGRVLAGVRARHLAGSRRTAWAWGMGVAAVAALVTLLVVHGPYRPPAPLPITAGAPANLSAPSVAKVTSTGQALTSHRPQRPAPPSRVDTRPQQFPTPRPLSKQEKLLLVYAQSLKGSSVTSASSADQDVEHDLEIPPLSIAEIKIEPLAPEEKNGDEK